MHQGLTNPLSGCLGQVKIFAGQVKYFLTCPEKCIRYTGKPKEIQYFVAEVLHRTSRSNFYLSSPGPEVIKPFSCSTQLSMKFFLLINVKMPTIVGILTFMSGKKSILGLSEPKKSRIS